MSNENTTVATVATVADSTVSAKDTNMANTNSTSTSNRRNRNRSSKRDVSIGTKSELFASVSNNVSKDIKAADTEAREQARKGHQTYEQVCENFEGLNQYLDSIVSGLLIHAGVLDEDSMLLVEGLSNRNYWLRQSTAHKAGVALMKGMLNRVPRRDENGQVVRFQEGHRLAGKVVLVREGTRSLPEFNDSEEAEHGKRLFSTTECAAIHGAFWSKWEQHPVVAAIVKQHEDFQNQRQIDTANRGRKTAKTFTKDELASQEDVSKVKGQSDEGFNTMSVALEEAGAKPTHHVYVRNGKEIKARLPRRNKKSNTASAE